MLRTCTFAFLISVTVSTTAASAAERGVVLRAGDIKVQPFIDAASATTVTANEPVTVIDRKGGWMEVTAAGKTGWIRMLNVRLAGADTAGSAAHSGNLLTSASLLRTGSSGKTVTTGVKGLGEENLRNATVNTAELAKLSTLAVDPAEATANAKRSGLKETQADYLTKGGKN